MHAISDLAQSPAFADPLRRVLPAFSVLLLSLSSSATMPLVSAAEEGNEPQTTSSATVRSVPDDDAHVVATIDRLIRAGWQDAKIRPSPEAASGEWCRRLFLDIVGRTPSASETNEFLNNRSRDRREELVDELLGDEYSTDYAQNWATLWTNLLIGRGAAQNRRSLVSREGVMQYLHASFYENKAYDQLVGELISAEGVNKPGYPDYNGAVNYLLAHLADNGVEATARTARLFLGLQVQCTQCHGHPFNTWKQSQFWGLNAFFRQARPLRRYQGRDIDHVRLADEDYADAEGDASEAVVFYIDRSEHTHAIGPTFVDGTKISASGYVDEVNRRDELARLLIQSDYLPKALVNRMWGHFFTYGFTKPVDDMGPHNPPSHLELLEYLAEQFRAHGYDLKTLIRWIALSEAYALSSRAGRNNESDDPTAGAMPLFSRFYVRQMRAEELYESLLVATEVDRATGGDEEQRQQMKQSWLSQFVIAFGTDENDEATTFNGTISQSLMMMNSDLMRRASECRPGNFLHTVATSDISDAEKIDRLYLAALSRKSSRDERRMAQQLWRARDGDSKAALEDIWWALLNSNEFILKH